MPVELAYNQVNQKRDRGREKRRMKKYVSAVIKDKLI